MPFFIYESKSEFTMSSLLYCFVVLAALGTAIAFPGEYVPKSFYTLDENGHKSDVIYLRKSFAPRFRRSSGSSSYSGVGGGGSIGFDGPTDVAAAVEAGLGSTFQQLRSLASQSGAGGHGGGGYSGSFSSSSGPGSGGQGPVLYSRFAQDAGGSEKELVTGGNGRVHAAASANGQNGGFSFSSSSVDGDGNVRYNTHARKF